MSDPRIEAYFDRLWPICRSITGNGLRQSLSIVSEVVDALVCTEVASGTRLFDWEVPLEWNIEDAWLECPDGRKVARFTDSNLHVLNYSEPVEKSLSWEELTPHLFTLPHMPNAVPYVTTYYKKHWGFCLSHAEWEKLPREGTYKAVIKSRLQPGSLTYGEAVLPGTSGKEVLFSTYLCHPSMALNELSGPLVQMFLYEAIRALPNRRHTYRFVFAPETIGTIAYLARRGFGFKQNLLAGYVLTTTGDGGAFTYKKSRRGNTLADRMAEHMLSHQPEPFSVIPFSIGGSDERQYCSPGFDLPVGSLMRTPYQTYPEYHTSLDNKNLMDFAAVERTIQLYLNIVKGLERNAYYFNTVQFCEPHLDKRGLYNAVGGTKDRARELSLRLHLLNLADGHHDLLDIADRYGCNLLEFEENLTLLLADGILEELKK